MQEQARRGVRGLIDGLFRDCAKRSTEHILQEGLRARVGWPADERRS